MEFILEQQAKAELHNAKAEERIAKPEERFNRKIDVITKLVHTGMKMLVANQKETAELRKSQKETDRLLRAFLKSMDRGSNGRKAS
jgi:hypothetical protein